MTKSILIVDDEEDVRAIAQLGLEMSGGWTVFSASCGKEAIVTAMAEKLDVILLDLMMPDMDGFKTLEYLKANPETQNIPVILVTAKEETTLPQNLINLNLLAILSKPFRPLLLGEQINQALLKSVDSKPL